VRPGEKLFEEILTTEEVAAATRHKKIFVAKDEEPDADILDGELKEKTSVPIDAYAEQGRDVLVGILDLCHVHRRCAPERQVQS